MSNYRKIVSITIGIMFLYIAVKLVPPTASTIGLAFLKSTAILTIIGNILIILVLLWLFTKRNAIVNKLFKDENEIDIDKSITFPQAINLVCIFAGLIVLGSAIPTLLTGLSVYNMIIKSDIITKNITKQEINIAQFELFVGLILKLVIGLYLVCGAPHFVRWQIKRIKKLTEQTVE